ncbi:MAG: hypothetical protein KQI81_08715 [Deltaproteobacteria bacterium]|nr:hypothetical protein [Deltaproteobacteria bacterium]
MIKIAQRAVVTDAFITAIQDECRTQLEKYRNMPPGRREIIAKTNGVPITRMLQMLKPDGVDTLKTRLRCLDYEEFDAIDHDGRMYLRATTKPIISKVYDSQHREPLDFQMDYGKYYVYFPASYLNDCVIGALHFIPARDPRNLQRTPHNNVLDVPDNNPLHASPRICWGSFGSYPAQMFQAFNISEIYRSLHLYLSTTYLSSLLIPPMTYETKPGLHPGVSRVMAAMPFARMIA